MYVDNLGVMSLGAATTNFDRVGLKTHKHASSNGQATVLGNLLDGTAKETRIAPKRRWRLFWALTSVLRTQRLSPSARVGARVHSLSSDGLAEAAGLDAIYLQIAEDATTDDAPMWERTADVLEVPRTMLRT